jgi:hypothetical protein
MALPKVTPGTYNYGEYANPTPIRYRGGQEAIGAAIGQGLAAAGQTIGQSIKQNKAEKEKEKEILDKAIVDAYNRFDKETKMQNTQSVIDISEQHGQLDFDFRKGIYTREEYLKQKTVLDAAVEDIIALHQVKDKIDLDGVKPSMLKDNNSLKNFLLQKSLESGNAKEIWDPETKQWFLEYQGLDMSKLDGKTVQEINGIPEEAYTTQRVPVSEMIANPDNYFDLKTKIDFNNDSMVDLFSKTAKVFDQQMGDMYKTGVRNGYQVLDEEAAANAFAESAQVNAIYQKIGKDVAEDILDQEYTGSEEQELEIKQAISQQIIGYAEKQGNKAVVAKTKPQEDYLTERTGYNLDDRRIAFNNIVSLQPGQTYSIKYKGSNDVEKEDYVIARDEEGQLLFTKVNGTGAPSVISEQDLIKEFGMQDLVTQNKADQAGLKF